MMRIVLFFAVIAALSTPLAQASDKPLILSTIKPIHMLVSAVAGDTVDTQQMIPDYASPHHYSLKPSDLRRLNKARLVFRIDAKMETNLNKSLSQLDSKQQITLSQTKHLTLLSTTHHHEHEDEDDHSEEDSAEKDYHLWLSPKNAILMTEAIREALTQDMPELRETFKLNADTLIQKIKKTDHEISQLLKGVSKQPFLGMHDAWQYFTHYYALNQLDSVSKQEGNPSARALSEARGLINKGSVACIVNEPGVKIRTLKVLTEGFDVNTTEIDPLGREIPISVRAYPDLLRYTANQLLQCLTPQTD